MNPTIQLLVDRWSTSQQGPREIRETTCYLSIKISDKIATRIEDRWSKTVDDRIHISAYPLAIWLAASWWRLRWEPRPRSTPGLDWKMSHLMPAAGHGYLWPVLQIDCDGEEAFITCTSTSQVDHEPIRFLSSFDATAKVRDLEAAIDDFIEFVTLRLQSIEIHDSELQRLWKEILEERNDAEASRYRRLEAQLGFEAGEGPEDLLDRLLSLRTRAGEEAIGEIALACSGSDPSGALSGILERIEAGGVTGKLRIPSLQKPGAELPPWQRGRQLASTARKSSGISTDRVEDTVLEEILGAKLSSGLLSTKNKVSAGIVVRDPDTGSAKYHFRRHNSSGLRFEAARFMGDALIAPAEDRWLMESDSNSARQKLQRAFAAEFLCPIDRLTEFLGGDFSNEAIDEAGMHFQVSSLAIQSHLANHQVISPF